MACYEWASSPPTSAGVAGFSYQTKNIRAGNSSPSDLNPWRVFEDKFQAPYGLSGSRAHFPQWYP
jgi:hypothetical protein